MSPKFGAAGSCLAPERSSTTVVSPCSRYSRLCPRRTCTTCEPAQSAVPHPDLPEVYLRDRHGRGVRLLLVRYSLFVTLLIIIVIRHHRLLGGCGPAMASATTCCRCSGLPRSATHAK